MTKEISFICVQNAGRSQIAEAIAKKIREERDLDIEISSGGTNPANEIHKNVKEILKEQNLLREDMEPSHISRNELKEKDYVITMGCDIQKGCPTNMDIETIEWKIKDPQNRDKKETDEIKKEIQKKVQELLKKPEIKKN